MSHSKRNTSLAFFTNYERSQLKGSWGSQKARLTRESFLSIAACHLCLQSAREPVACRDGGHVFCKECAVMNILAQKKEIQRLDKEEARRQDEDHETEKEKADEAHEEVVRNFEKTVMGLDSDGNTKKRKSELITDDGEDQRDVVRRKVDIEKPFASKENYWMPASMQQTKRSDQQSSRKQQPVCPSGSAKETHSLSLKSLVAINFTASTSVSSNSDNHSATTEVNGKTFGIICPSCKKGLSTSSKAILTVPCGHVICKTCVERFMEVTGASTAGKHSTALTNAAPLVCAVCQTDLSPLAKDKKISKKSKSKEEIRPGLIELSSSGTGFAGGGKAEIRKEGVAFQC